MDLHLELKGLPPLYMEMGIKSEWKKCEKGSDILKFGE